MQKGPVKQSESKNQAVSTVHSGGNNSPALLMAKKVYQEQGTEQLKLFLAAMEPFVAPNELKIICDGFGIDINNIPIKSNRKQPLAGKQNANQLQLIQLIMGMQNMGKNGMDVGKIMKLMSGFNQ